MDLCFGGKRRETVEEIKRVCILFVKGGDLGFREPVWPLAWLREREWQSSGKGKAESGFKMVLLCFFFFFNIILTWKFVGASKISVLYIYRLVANPYNAWKNTKYIYKIYITL